MVEYLLTLLIFLVIVYAFVKGCNININVTLKQEFNDEERQLLEDLYNNDGDLKKRDDTVVEALDEAVRNINNIILGVEEETDG